MFIIGCGLIIAAFLVCFIVVGLCNALKSIEWEDY